MARKRPRRIKFSPFRMGERFQKSVLVALGIFLMVIFAVPFAGPCRGRRGGQGDSATWATLDGEEITYGQLRDTWRRWVRVVGAKLDRDNDVGLLIAQLREAEQAGIRVSDPEVVDAVRTRVFPRRVKVEYVVAETSQFAKALPEGLPEAERSKRASEQAEAAVAALKAKVDPVVGAEAEGALRRFAGDLSFGETRPFTAREAKGQLSEIREAPDIDRRVFTQPIGQLSEPLPVAGGFCVFRVVLRTRGFGPDGLYHAEQEGWAGEGYGPINVKAYAELLRDLQVTQAELERTLREQIRLEMLSQLLRGTATALPHYTIRDRYYRDNTQAAAAYFAVRTADFTDAVRHTDAELRAFYDKHKTVPRSPTRVGYLQPPRVRIEYVLGRKHDVERTLSELTLRKYYTRYRDQLDGSYEDSLPKLRGLAADHELKRLISTVAGQAASEVAAGRDPNFATLASQAARLAGGAFEHGRTEQFSAADAESVVPKLRGGKLGKILFGDEARQYAVAGEEPKEGMHVVSDDFECDDGRFFFRILERRGSQEVPYDSIPDHTRSQLVKDYVEHQAFEAARQKAVDYRSQIHEEALEQFARSLGLEAATTDYLMPETPIPPLGATVPALYGELERAEIGDLSSVVEAGGHFAVARLLDREPNKGLKLQVVALPAKHAAEGAAKPARYQPSAYELRAAYADDPYRYLDQPKPVPFADVQADIATLLKRRRALALATERADAAAAELAAAPKPDLPAVAAKHKLAVRRNVAVDLAHTAAAPQIGRAAGFHDAVTALKPGEASKALASAAGRFVFVLTARTDKTATLDVAAALYKPLIAQTQVDPADVRTYYDDHRDTAYMTDDKIETAPPWDDLPQAARDRIATALRDAWAKQPALERLRQLRDALVQQAFDTVPVRSPITTSRPVQPALRRVGPFSLSSPQGPFASSPALLKALRALKVGQLAPAVTTQSAAALAFLAERKPGGRATVSVAVFGAPQFLRVAAEPTAAALQRHYAEHKESFRVPETATLEYLFADLNPRQIALAPKLAEADCRVYYRAHFARRYVGRTYEQARERVRADLARERAQQQARGDAEAALEALRKNPKAGKAELAALATKHKLVFATSEPLPLADPVKLPDAGQLRPLAAELRQAKPGDLMPRLVAADRGYLVCRLAGRHPARVPPFAEIRKRVRRAYLLHSARAAARTAAGAFRKAAAASSFEKALATPTTPAPAVVRNIAAKAPSLALPRRGPQPALATQVFALRTPGLTPVVDLRDGSCVAWVSQRRPDELLTADVATIAAAHVSDATIDIPDDEVREHFDSTREEYREPDKLQIEYLAVTFDQLRKSLTATDDELRKEYDRSTTARETIYKDHTKPGLQFLPLEKARDRVRRRVLDTKAAAEARKLLAAAAAALRKQGAAADLAAYADAHPTLQRGLSSFFDRTRQGLEPLGDARELIRAAFAAKQGELVGPVFGKDGGCLFRRHESRPSRIPPFDEVRYRVEAKLRRQRALERARKLADELRRKVAPAVAKADDKRDAFRTAIQRAALAVELPKPVRVTVTRPFYPLAAGWGHSSDIPGLGQKPDLVRAIFRLRKGELTPAIDDADGSACYIATLVRLTQPDKPDDRSLYVTRAMAQRRAQNAFLASWMQLLSERLQLVR